MTVFETGPAPPEPSAPAPTPTHETLVAERWSDENLVAVDATTQWTVVPAAQANLARRLSGDEAIDWVEHSRRFVAALGRPARVLSLGCGFGVLERRLVDIGICTSAHGLDIAPGAVEGARRLAAAAGMTGLTYEVADLNTSQLPEAAYDVVYAHASLHHVFQLEHLLGEIQRTLVPDGLLIVFDYVGPSYMQFSRELLMLADDLLMTIPERLRWDLRVKQVKRSCYRIPLKEIIGFDPSEGVRAQEIVPLIAARFKIEHVRSLGGTLQMLVFSDISGNFLNADDAEARTESQRIVDIDNRLVDSGIVPSFHAYLVCRRTENPLVVQVENARIGAAPHIIVRSLDEDSWLLDWHTAEADSGVTVAVDGGAPQPLIHGPSGLRTVHIEPAAPEQRAPGRPFLAASPNPVPPGTTTTTLSWQARGAVSVTVSIDDDPAETSLGVGPGGAVEIPWINPGQTYTFRLYDEDGLLDTCTVRQGARAALRLPPGSVYTFTVVDAERQPLMTTSVRRPGTIPEPLTTPALPPISAPSAPFATSPMAPPAASSVAPRTAPPGTLRTAAPVAPLSVPAVVSFVAQALRWRLRRLRKRTTRRLQEVRATVRGRLP